LDGNGTPGLWIPKSHATFATTHATNLDDTLAVKQDEVRLGLLGPVETFADFWNIGWNIL
jgi:hypothetical protein